MRQRVYIGKVNVKDLRDQIDGIFYLAHNVFQNSEVVSEPLLGGGELLMAIYQAIQDIDEDGQVSITFVDKEVVIEVQDKDVGYNKYSHREFVHAAQSYKRLVKECPWPLGYISKDLEVDDAV